ncbi:MAG TPA: hypothetical protein PKD79_01810 [Candidatus Doudnabacteria bacterium]|nr:hypothetical protein [Candidatus Doudnabacteria bacterium]
MNADIKAEFQKIHKQFTRFDKRLDGFDKRLDSFERKFATKDDLTAQTKELKEFAEDQTEFLAQTIAKTVANPLQKHLDNSSVHQGLVVRVDALEHDVSVIKKKLVVK